MYLIRKFRKSQILWFLCYTYVGIIIYFCILRDTGSKVSLEDVLIETKKILTEIANANDMGEKLEILLEMESK